MPTARPRSWSPKRMVSDPDDGDVHGSSFLLASVLASGDGPERERHDFVAVVVGTERPDDELHLHPVREPTGLGLSQARLHLDLVEVDIAEPEWLERVARRPGVRRRRRWELLRGPCP